MSTLVKEHLNRYWTAQMFLTRLPVPKSIKWSDQALANSTLYFPVVGVVVGLMAGIVYQVSLALWTTQLAAVAAIALTIVITGAFHEDGVADSADGIGGAFDIDKKLSIMRDSRIGTYGSVALILTILAKVFAIIAIDTPDIIAVFICAHCLARWTPLPLIAHNPYLREDGTGKPFAAAVSKRSLIITSLLTACITWVFASTFALILLCAVILFVLLSHWYVRRKLGGITGDVLGAVNSLTELLVYLLFGLSIG